MSEKPEGWPATATLPDLTAEQKAEQRERLDMLLRLAAGAALRAMTTEPYPHYHSLAPATRTRHEVHRAIAFLLSHGLITVVPETFEQMFSLDFEIPDHLSDAEDMRAAYARGF